MVLTAVSSLVLAVCFQVAPPATGPAPTPSAAPTQSTAPAKAAANVADDATVVQGPLAEKLDAYVARLEKSGFSGTVLVASGGALVLRKGYGLSNRKDDIHCAPDTVYDIGSITKQFTAAAILKLESMGKLAVGDLLSKHLEGVPEDKKAITLHHLLSHQAGLPDEIGRDYEEIGREPFLERALACKLLSEPGTRYHYSNVGFSILAALIEKLSGNSYEEFLAKHLFEPAGMATTGYLLPKWDERHLAVGYRGQEAWGTPLDHAWSDDGPYWNLLGNGGILSTATDMFRWHVALSDDRVLPQAQRVKLVTPYVKEDASGTTHYAYGWVIAKSPKGTPVFTHNGGNGVFFADYFRLPEENVVVFLATNHGAAVQQDLAQKLVRMAIAAE